jgi:hypothetical protein
MPRLALRTVKRRRLTATTSVLSIVTATATQCVTVAYPLALPTLGIVRGTRSGARAVPCHMRLSARSITPTTAQLLTPLVPVATADTLWCAKETMETAFHVRTNRAGPVGDQEVHRLVSHNAKRS